MKNKICLVLLLSAILLCGCGKKEILFENVPDPTHYFSKNVDINRYELQGIKGVDFTGTGRDDLEDIFKKYTKDCEEVGEWTNIMYSGDTSWCYKNKDESLRLAVNWYPDTNMLSVTVVELDEEN